MKFPFLNMVRMFVLLACLAPAGALFAQAQPQAQADGEAIHIDVPVNLKKANVVFNNGHATFAGDVPLSLKYMGLLSANLKKHGVKYDIIGVFHGAATYMVLNDQAYDAARKVGTGNPYKGLVAELIKENITIEVCAVALANNHWTNADLLPGVKVDTGGLMRIIELTQKGYTQIQP